MTLPQSDFGCFLLCVGIAACLIFVGWVCNMVYLYIEQDLKFREERHKHLYGTIKETKKRNESH